MAASVTPAERALFWYWINERHRIYCARLAGAPKPWTSDVILRDYKFTNVFRQLDRGTAWLTEHFIAPHRHGSPALLVFNVCWYRMFNWVGTGELLGWQESWPEAAIVARLTRAQKAGAQIFTGAHIVWAGSGPKIDGVVRICKDLWWQRLNVVAMAGYTKSLQRTFELLREVHGVGGFMAYEMVTDLRHTPVLESACDINTWANMGPGAFRGLRRLFPEMTSKDGLGRMCDLLTESRGRLEAHVPDLELRDIEHSLCEFDKYCRVKFGEGRPRAAYPGAA